MKTSQHVGFRSQQELVSKQHISANFTPWKWYFFTFFALWKSIILRWNYNNVPNFVLKVLYCVRFWFEKVSMCENLKKLVKHASEFEMNVLQFFRFRVSFFCSLPSFHAFIKVGHVSEMFWTLMWVRLVELLC